MRRHPLLLLELLETLWEAVAEKGAWRRLLGLLERGLDLDSAHLLVQEAPSGRVLPGPWSDALDEGVSSEPSSSEALRCWGKTAPRLPTGSIIDRTPAAPGRPAQNPGSAQFLGLVALGAGSARICSLVLFRRRTTGPWEPEELDLLQSFLPLLGRAFRLSRQLAVADSHRHIAHATFDRLAHGLLILDPEGRVSFRNRAAQEILARGDGLSLRQNRLRVRDARRQELLDGLVDRVLRESPSADSSGWLSVARPSGRRPYCLHVVGLSPSATGFRGGAGAIFVSDPDRPLRLAPDVLAQLYGLTRAESRIAALIASGSTPEEIADRLDIGITTVRSHLARLFSKTGTGRQSELVRLLVTGPIQGAWNEPGATPAAIAGPEGDRRGRRPSSARPHPDGRDAPTSSLAKGPLRPRNNFPLGSDAAPFGG